MAANPPPKPARMIFILRLWPDQNGRSAWQGEVESVPDQGGSRNIRRIHSAGELLDYLHNSMLQDDPPPSAPPPTGLR